MECTASAQMAPQGHDDIYYWLAAHLTPVLTLNCSWLVSRPCRRATIAWATILEPYHLVASLQIVWK